MKYPCSNSQCTNNVKKAGQYCPSCQAEVDRIIKDVWRDAEAEERRRKLEQDEKHNRKEGKE